MLYILEDPRGRCALLRLADLDRWTTLRERLVPLARRSEIDGVALALVVVAGAASACGAVPELECAERLVEGEEYASDRLATPPSVTVAVTRWFAPPGDWAERLRREDVGLYLEPLPLLRLRERGHLPRPRFPSDRPVPLCRYCGRPSSNAGANGSADKQFRALSCAGRRGAASRPG